ncbi:MAG TPA: hypothetical protein VLR89_08640 [Anaerolineaceae bacterium]|nr:hypothetical protein [Anaerolineaceae bacterium]
MKTPFGRECKFFYGDYFRGRNVEECRALSADEKGKWKVELCKDCPMPQIQTNNACPNLMLSADIVKPFLRPEKISVQAWCTKVHDLVKDPNIGCPVCHQDQQTH